MTIYDGGQVHGGRHRDVSYPCDGEQCERC